MNTSNESVPSQTTAITFGLVVSWIFGVAAGLSGLVLFLDQSFVVGLLFLVMAFIVLPPTDKIIKTKLHISFSRGLKVAAVIVLLIVAGFSSSNSEKSAIVTSNSISGKLTSATTEPAKPPIVVTAVKLSEDYKANEVAADAKYKDNPVKVSGIIYSISKDILDNPFVSLQGDQYGVNNVHCTFPRNDEPELAKISKGQQITLQGSVSGKMMDVIVNDCQIVE